MEDQSCDQAEILERVRHLSGETDAINDIFSSNQSVRMNFGVPQVGFYLLSDLTIIKT